MKPVSELINKEEPGWPLVQQWLDGATNEVTILTCDSAKAEEALYQTQVSTRSPMGAVIHTTGGMLIDHGWIRVLGSGSPKLNRTLPAWNLGKSMNTYEERPGFLLVADDAIGGLFALNGGALGPDGGKLYYLAPDTLEWEDTDLSYSEFIHFCLYGNLNEFYEGFRWKGWEKEVGILDGNEAFSFYPFLWSKEGQEDINKNTRKKISIEASYKLTMDTRKQLEEE